MKELDMNVLKMKVSSFYIIGFMFIIVLILYNKVLVIKS